MITNGDFSDGDTYWHLVGTGTAVVTNGEYCVSSDYGETFTVGWPVDPSDAAILSASTPYTFSYQASATTTVEVEAKIGHAVSPYDTDFLTSLDAIGSSPQTFVHSFTTTTADDAAGIAFTVTLLGTGQICFDNVALTSP